MDMNTPDTEWDKITFENEFAGWWDYKTALTERIEDHITHLLSSRDTYWKERVRKEVKDAYEHAEIVRQRTLNEIRQAVEDDESYGGAKECVYKILDRY
jgi:hypothetical protein